MAVVVRNVNRATTGVSVLLLLVDVYTPAVEPTSPAVDSEVCFLYTRRPGPPQSRRRHSPLLTSRNGIPPHHHLRLAKYPLRYFFFTVQAYMIVWGGCNK